MLQDFFTVAPTDSFSQCLKNQFCDLGSISRRLTALSYSYSLEITNNSKELHRYRDLIYTKKQILNHMNHAMQGVVSFNEIMSSDILKSRLLDCVPSELQDKVEKPEEDHN